MVLPAMEPSTGSFRLSSARRGGPKGSPTLVVAVLAVLAINSLVVLLAPSNEEPEASPTPTPAPAASPTPTRTPSPTAGPERGRSAWVEAEVILPPSPTPTWPVAEAAPTRLPRPTPSISQCAAYRWSTSQVFTLSAQVKVDIRVDNRCPYELGPSNLLFDISGWRDGGLVQSVRGVPFETIRRGRSGDLSIGLPGSETWYDRIDVVVFD